MKKLMKYISLAVIVFLFSLIVGFLVGQQQNQTQKEGLDSSETSQAATTDVVLSFESIDLSQNPTSLKMGEQTQFSALTQPAESEDNVYWYTFDSGIIHVSDSGLVTPLQAGTATLVAQSELNTDFEVSMTITVLPAEDFVQIESIEIDKSEFKYIVNHGDVSKIKVNIYPENATVTDLVFETDYGAMLQLTPNGRSVEAKAIGGIGDAYVIVKSHSDPGVYEKVELTVFPNAHPNSSSLTYTAGDVITRANTEWGWYRMTLLTVNDLMPVDYSARHTKSLETSMENDNVVIGNAKDYPEMCAAGFEDACVGVDAFVQMFKFTDEANEGMYRLLVEFAGDDLDELWAITETQGFDGGSYYYNNRWFHFGYMDFGLVLLISGQEYLNDDNQKINELQGVIPGNQIEVVEEEYNNPLVTMISRFKNDGEVKIISPDEEVLLKHVAKSKLSTSQWLGTTSYTPQNPTDLTQLNVIYSRFRSYSQEPTYPIATVSIHDVRLFEDLNQTGRIGIAVLFDINNITDDIIDIGTHNKYDGWLSTNFMAFNKETRLEVAESNEKILKWIGEISDIENIYSSDYMMMISSHIEYGGGAENAINCTTSSLEINPQDSLLCYQHFTYAGPGEYILNMGQSLGLSESQEWDYIMTLPEDLKNKSLFTKE